MGTAGQTMEPRSALLIGIGRYDNSDDLKSLAGPRVDVQNMRSVLGDPAVGAYRVETLEDVDSSTACAHLEDFLRDRSENETCLLYFSGHGFIDARGALYLCTTNASFKRPKTSTIPAEFISGLIDDCQSKRVVLVLDCCYSGNYDGAAKSGDIVQPQFGGTGFGRVVLTAGAENQLAWDNGETGSLFSRHIAEGIRSGAADTDGDGRITVQELYDYVYRKVVTERPTQRPGKNTYRESGPSFLVAESPVKPERVLPVWVKHELSSDFADNRLAVLKRLDDFVSRNPWARDLAIHAIRPTLEDDSNRVQRAARELLDRLVDGPVRAPATARPETPSPPPPRSDPPPAISVSQVVAEPATQPAIGSLAPAQIEFPLRTETTVWGLWAAFAPLVCIVLLVQAGIFPIYFAPYFGASLMLAAYLSYLAVRYRVVASAKGLLTSVPWWSAIVCIVASVLSNATLRQYEWVGLVIFAFLGAIPFILLLKISLRLRTGPAIGFGFLAFLVCLLSFGTLHEFGLTADAICVLSFLIAAPLIFSFGAIARSRYLRTHGG